MSPPLTKKASRSDSNLDDKRSYKSGNEVEVVHASVGVDVAVSLVAGRADDAPLDPQEARALRMKLDKRLLPLLFLIYTLQAIDKNTLGASAILGIIQDAKLSTDEFNTLGSAFYIGYLAFQYPQNWALQRFPVAKWLSINIFLWAIFLGLHSVCTSFGPLFVLRFFLGASEGCITAGLMIVTSMFYTRTEIGERIGWTFQCNGIAAVISGFLSFGVYHANPTAKPNRWQWLFIAVTILTALCGAIFLWLFPDNPTTARFLTQDEKRKVVKRIVSNQNGIETKVWKKHQFIEALTDPKTWLFFLFGAISNLQSGVGVQYSLIIKAFGFTTLQTTLLNIPAGTIQIIGITLGGLCLRKWQNSRAYIAVAFFIPSILACLLLMLLPQGNKNGLLGAFYVLYFGGSASFVMVLAWVTSTCAGHTKKVATNAIFLIGYSLGQILAPQFWKQQYRPRNQVPWGIILASYVTDIVLLLVIRWYLNRENKRRDAKRGDTEDDEMGYIETTNPDGTITRQKIEKAMLDLTDRENKSFRYCL